MKAAQCCKVQARFASGAHQLLEGHIQESLEKLTQQSLKVCYVSRKNATGVLGNGFHTNFFKF